MHHFLFFRIVHHTKNSSISRLGFTLIELVLVIGIIGMLSSLTFYILNPFEQFKKGSDSQRKSDLAQVQRALEAYYQDFGQYPDSSNNKIVYNSSELSWGSAWSPYIEVLPKDPNSSKTYVYLVGSGNQSYQLYASLDRGGKDTQACNVNGTACPGAESGGVSCGGSNACSYGASSPNTSP